MGNMVNFEIRNMVLESSNSFSRLTGRARDQLNCRMGHVRNSHLMAVIRKQWYQLILQGTNKSHYKVGRFLFLQVYNNLVTSHPSF